MDQQFFVHNRQRLDGLTVMSAYSQMQRGNDAAFQFEQEANFWYLTGITAPDWWVIIDGDKSWLVAPEVDEVHQVFNASLSWNKATEISGIDTVISRNEAQDLLQHLALTKKVVHHTCGPIPTRNSMICRQPARKETCRSI